MSTRPALLLLGTESNFDEYQQHFKFQLEDAGVIDALGREVVFRSSDCRHVCYETDKDNYNAGKRTAWSQERAERISWIRLALTEPFEIRPNEVRNRETFLIRMDADPANSHPQENFAVIVERINSSRVAFVTAFPHNHSKWVSFRKEGKKLYPKDE